MNREEFIKSVETLNITISPKQLDQLEKYYRLLVEWNEKINLTSIIEKEQVYLKHFYDSLTINKVIDLSKEYTLCDIGTGAGFPGLVLKIVFPNLKITLVDALNKRVNFLNQVIEQLDLKDIIVVHDRMEEYAKKHIEEYDIITARAVSHLSNLLEYGVSATKIGGFLIFLKGNIREEIKEAENAIQKLRVKLIKIEEFNLPFENSQRTIIKFQKKEKTPSKYPRKYSEMKKKRL